MGKTADVIQKDSDYKYWRNHQRNIRSMQTGYGYLLQRQMGIYPFDQVVERRKYKNLKTECEHVAEF